ncbi:MAG: hypothetical protein WKF37_08060 [Bryobacteraceae bacterium]
MRAAIALPFGSWMSRYQAAAAPFQGEVKITAIKAMALDYTFDGCLIKIETDAGISGYGETGTDVAMARSHINHIGTRAALIGEDPSRLSATSFA